MDHFRAMSVSFFYEGGSGSVHAASNFPVFMFTLMVVDVIYIYIFIIYYRYTDQY